MPKLFTAVDIPEEASEALTRLQPAPKPGLRNVRPDQMHLTLHFIGDAEIDRVAALLESIAVPSFSITLKGVGQFPSAEGSVTLWAGVAPDSGLQRLHEAIGAALAHGGFRIEARPYRPHLTLARWAKEIDARVIEDFLAKHTDFVLPNVAIPRFRLYSSSSAAGVPEYRPERDFVLVRRGEFE
jgi:2'-5' RNA ligase